MDQWGLEIYKSLDYDKWALIFSLDEVRYSLVQICVQYWMENNPSNDEYKIIVRRVNF